VVKAKPARMVARKRCLNLFIIYYSVAVIPAGRSSVKTLSLVTTPADGGQSQQIRTARILKQFIHILHPAIIDRGWKNPGLWTKM
jgi:hypothetical protein